MSLKVEFHFDFGSPNAYLSHLAIPQIEARTGIVFDYVPILLGGVFKETNNVSPVISLQGVKNKPDYAQIETRRFLTAYGVEAYQINPHFPVNTLTIMRAALFAKTQKYFATYVDAIFKCMWQQGKKMDDLTVMQVALTEAGLPAEAIMAATQDADIKQKLISSTQASVAKGTFGSPTFFVGDEIYFGKEKLRDLEEVARSNKKKQTEGR